MKRLISLGLVLIILLSTFVAAFADTYVVEEGDVLWKIARDHDTSVNEIIKLNDLENGNKIHVDQVLELPGDNENTALEDLKAGKNRVTFKSFGVDLVGDLYLPEGFDPSQKYTAIVGASPFPQVKEQVLATYGSEMADRGFIFLGFDYLGMGESPALPGEFMQSRYLFRLIENTWDAVSYLGTLPFVDEINGLGVCQGGTIIASAAVTDHRISKIATVSGMMGSDARSWGNAEYTNRAIAAANASRQKIYETGQPDYTAPFGLTDEMSKEDYVGIAGPMGEETYDYYGRDGVRGPVAVDGYTNMHIGDQAMQSQISIAEHYADKIVQPTLVIYGTTAGTAIASTTFIDNLTNEHEVLALDQFSHVDFYYEPEAVRISTDAVAEFFNKTEEESNADRSELETQARGFIDMALAPKLNNAVVKTPADHNLDFEEVNFMTSDGVNISAWLVKGGTDKVVIQAHPVTRNKSGRTEDLDKSKMASDFVNAGYTVLMFDARNHGASDVGPVPYAVGSVDDAPDFVAAVDYILSREEYADSSIGINAECFGVNAVSAAFSIPDGLQTRSNLKAITLTQPASWGMLMRPQLGDELFDEVNRQIAEEGAKSLDDTPLEHASMITVPTLVVQNQNDPSGTLDFVNTFYSEIETEKDLWMFEGEADRSYAYKHIVNDNARLIEWFDEHLQ